MTSSGGGASYVVRYLSKVDEEIVGGHRILCPRTLDAQRFDDCFRLPTPPSNVPLSLSIPNAYIEPVAPD